MFVNFWVRVVTGFVFLGLVCGGSLLENNDKEQGRGLGGLLGLGGKKSMSSVYSPSFDPFAPPPVAAASATSEVIKYKLYTLNSTQSPLTILSSKKLKKNEKKFTPGAPMKLIISDWMYDDGSQLIPAQNIKNAFIMQKRPINVMIVDWSGIGAAFYAGTAVEAVKKAGKKISDFITSLIKEELLKSVKDLEIIGMGGGAHVAAIISHKLKKDGGDSIPRITGLDPTGPGFDKASEENKLDSSDADFVDVLHCNEMQQDTGNWWSFAHPSFGKERFMGIKEPCGSMDTFINGGTKQPGCDGFMGHIESCSHTRCFDIYALTVKGLNLTGCECEDWGTFLTGSCDCKDGPFIGYPSPPKTSGVYYIKTKVDANTKVTSKKPKESKKSKEESSDEDEKEAKKPEKSEEEKDD